MGFLTKLLHQDKNGNLIDVLVSCQSQKLAIKKNAIEHAIDLISRTISKCEIEYYKHNFKENKIERVKNNNVYYRLNIKSNDNEIATTFMYNLISKLLKDEEILVVEINKKLYLADSFDYDNKILKEKTFYNIVLKDNKGNSITLEKKFKSNECMYLSLGLSKIKDCLDDYYKDIGKLISIQDNKYIVSNINKWKLNPPGTQPNIIDPKTGEKMDYSEYKERITEGLMSKEDSIVMLSKEFDLEKLSSDIVHNSEDLLRLQDKWEKDVARAFSIPLDVFNGSKTDKSTGTNDFITFAITSVTSILEDGFNSSLIKKENFLNGDMIKIKTLNIKHFDIFDCANSIDKLLSSGFSHDENRYFLGIPETGEKWAQRHHITKNYENVSDNSGGDSMG